MTIVVLGLGTNLGDRRANLEAALRLLKDADVAIERVSSVWETSPMPEDQPAYFNAVAVGSTDLSPRALLTTVKDIEHQLGRRPNRRWGPRPIDIDILFYGDEQVSEDGLVIPHEGIGDRGFVLAPLAEVVRGPLPVLRDTAVDLLAKAGTSGLRRSGALALP